MTVLTLSTRRAHNAPASHIEAGFDSPKERQLAASISNAAFLSRAVRPVWAACAGSRKARRGSSGLSTRTVPPSPFDSVAGGSTIELRSLAMQNNVQKPSTKDANGNSKISTRNGTNCQVGILRSKPSTQRNVLPANATGVELSKTCADGAHLGADETRKKAPKLKVKNGVATTTSLQVAEYFGKQHKDVIRAIRNMASEISPHEHERNFAPMFVDIKTGQGATRQSIAYTLTRDGFTLLAMGFTGKQAFRFKVEYIAAFNKLEAAALEKLKSRKTLPRAQRALPQPAAPVALPAPEQSLEQLALKQLRSATFVLYFDQAGDISLFSHSRQCIVAEPDQLADLIASTNSKISRELLPAIIGAAAGRLKP